MASGVCITGNMEQVKLSILIVSRGKQNTVNSRRGLAVQSGCASVLSWDIASDLAVENLCPQESLRIWNVKNDHAWESKGLYILDI